MGVVTFHPRKSILPRQACFLFLAPKSPPTVLFDASFLYSFSPRKIFLVKTFPHSLQAEVTSSDPCFPQFFENVVCDDPITFSHCVLSISACSPPRRLSSPEASRLVRYTWVVTGNACVFWPDVEQEFLHQGRHWVDQVCGLCGWSWVFSSIGPTPSTASSLWQFSLSP